MPDTLTAPAGSQVDPLRRVPSRHSRRRASSQRSASLRRRLQPPILPSVAEQPRASRSTPFGTRPQESGDLRDLVPVLTPRAERVYQRCQVHEVLAD